MNVYPLLRPVLMRLDPERAHDLTLALLRLTGALAPVRAVVRGLLSEAAARPVEAFGLRFPNAVGLAAGYDKDGLAWRGLACLGFGHLELGTVTPSPQAGNPRPRVFRLAEDRSLINRLGFPSRGAEFLARRLRDRPAGGPVVGVNIGKQRDTPLERAAEDYVSLIDRLAVAADYLAINVSSPNTPELRRLQERSWLEPLLARLVASRDRQQEILGRRVPLLVKLSPDWEEGQLERTVEVIGASGVDGIIATNTTIERPGIGSATADENGGLSGAALTRRSTEVVGRISRLTRGALPIVACGGILGPGDARAKLEAGATLLQLYTGLVYEGPGLVRRVARAADGIS